VISSEEEDDEEDEYEEELEDEEDDELDDWLEEEVDELGKTLILFFSNSINALSVAHASCSRASSASYAS
jgi:hypothetical protein